MRRIARHPRIANRSRFVSTMGVAVGLALAVSGCSSTSAAAPAASQAAPAPAPAPAAPPALAATPVRPRMPHIVGRITAENGTAWTVQTKDGQSHQVTVTPGTKFGTTKHPASQTQFPVGTHVRVNGPMTGDTITAAQIRHVVPKKKKAGSTAPASSAPAG